MYVFNTVNIVALFLKNVILSKSETRGREKTIDRLQCGSIYITDAFGRRKNKKPIVAQPINFELSMRCDLGISSRIFDHWKVKGYQKVTRSIAAFDCYVTLKVRHICVFNGQAKVIFRTPSI